MLQDGDIDLVEAAIDVALRMSPLRDSALTARKIGHCQRRVIGTPAFFATKGLPQTPADLVTHQAIIYEQRVGGATWTFRQGTAEASGTVGGRVHVTAAEGVREVVFAGLGFAIASEWMFAPELKSGAVISVLDDWSLPAVDLWAVFPTRTTGKRQSPSFRQLYGEPNVR